MHRGKLLTLLILLAAVAVAGFAVWFHHQQSSRVVEAISPNVAALIAYAPQAELLRVAPEKDADPNAIPPQILRLQGRSFYVTEQKDISGVKNFRTVRGWLIHNDNYDWSAPAAESKGPWQYALVFTQGPQHTMLLFDHTHEQMLLPETGQVLSTAPMNAGLKEFFDAQFAVERN
jgi:uncharacterized protein (UPF0333 family)